VSIEVAANALKEPHDFALPTVEVGDVNFWVVTREPETRTFARHMVAENDVNSMDAASLQLEAPIDVQPMEVVVDVRLPVASNQRSRLPSFVSSMVVERNVFLTVAKRSLVVVPSFVPPTAVVSDANWKDAPVWLLESRSCAEPTVAETTREAKRLPLHPSHTWVGQWEEHQCSFPVFERD